MPLYMPNMYTLLKTYIYLTVTIVVYFCLINDSSKNNPHLMDLRYISTLKPQPDTSYRVSPELKCYAKMCWK